MILTNLFEGRVSMRMDNGSTLDFTQSNYFVMQMTAAYSRPLVELAPGESLHFEHRFSEFLDTTRLGGAKYPTLSDRLRTGCQLQASVDIYQWVSVADGRKRSEKTAAVTSKPIVYTGPARPVPSNTRHS